MLVFGTLCSIHNHGGAVASSLLMVWSWSPSDQAQLITHHCGLFIISVTSSFMDLVSNIVLLTGQVLSAWLPNPSWASRPMKELAPSQCSTNIVIITTLVCILVNLLSLYLLTVATNSPVLKYLWNHSYLQIEELFLRKAINAFQKETYLNKVFWSVGWGKVSVSDTCVKSKCFTARHTNYANFAMQIKRVKRYSESFHC